MKYSETTGKILPAFEAFQAEIKHPLRTADNPFYSSKYTPLDALIDHVRPVLKKHGLYFTQEPWSDPTGVGVITTLFHTSGERMESEPYCVGVSKKDPQAYGAALTYARRYSLSALLGIASNSDDDAEVASRAEIRPVLDKKYKGWAKALAAVKAGETSVDFLQSKYEIPADCLKLLLDAANA